jgi:predicted class III extradiol MEMO1 family dioxygenase
MSTILHSKIKLSTKFVQYDQSEKVTRFDQSSVSYAASVTYEVEA